jgi:hypothetical protein
MRLPELVYRSVPGIIIFLGVTALYFASETYYLIRTPLYTNLVVITGLVLVINGILIVRVRKSNAARHGSNLFALLDQENCMSEKSIPDIN